MPMHQRPTPARSLSARAPRAQAARTRSYCPCWRARRTSARRAPPARCPLALAAPGSLPRLGHTRSGPPQVPELPVYGVAIPTVSGLRLVLDKLGAEQGGPPGAQQQHCLVALLVRLCIWRRMPFLSGLSLCLEESSVA
jgi:hypothetical protein